MNLLLEIIFKKKINNFIIILLSSLLTKITSDARSINTQINDIYIKYKFNNYINKNTKNIDKKNINIISYNNKIIVFGKLNTLEEIYKLDNLCLRYKNKNIKISRKLMINKNKINNSNYINKIKLYYILLKYNIIKLSNFKFFIKDENILIVGICNRKKSIKLIKLINFFFKNSKIIIAIIHDDFIVKIK